MKILITENQLRALSELEFKSSPAQQIASPEFMMGEAIPITFKIGEILYGKKRIIGFHTSEIGKINNIKNIIGKRKTISAFTQFYGNYNRYDSWRPFRGAQTYGGIIYKIEGDLLLSSDIDVRSRPDENGIRWVGSSLIIPRDILDNFNNGLNQVYKKYGLDPIRVNDFLSQKNNKNVTNFIKEYIAYTQNFIITNKDKILSFLSSEREGQGEDWNEVLLSNIQILEIIWCPEMIFEKDSHSDNYFYRYRMHNKDEYDVHTGYYHTINQNKLQSFINYIQKQLESLTNGNVYTCEDYDFNDFLNFNH